MGNWLDGTPFTGSLPASPSLTHFPPHLPVLSLPLLYSVPEFLPPSLLLGKDKLRLMGTGPQRRGHSATVTAPVYSALYCRPDTERTANPHKALVNKATTFPGARGRCRPKALMNLPRVQQPATQQGRVKPTKVCLWSDSLTGGSRGQSGEDGLSENLWRN